MSFRLNKWKWNGIFNWNFSHSMSIFYSQLHLLHATFQWRFHHSVHTVSNTIPGSLVQEIGGNGIYFDKGTCTIIKSCRRSTLDIKGEKVMLATNPLLQLQFLALWTCAPLMSAQKASRSFGTTRPMTSLSTDCHGRRSQVVTQRRSVPRKITPVPVKMLLTIGNMATRISIEKHVSSDKKFT